MRSPTIALIAHDRTKPDLLEWVGRHIDKIKEFTIIATGTTGGQIKKAHPDLNISTVMSGPLGGDQQVGAMIANGEIDIMVFLEDVMTAQPHDVDIKALLRLAILHELPLASNRITADLLMENLDMALKFRDQYPHPAERHLEYLQRNV